MSAPVKFIVVLMAVAFIGSIVIAYALPTRNTFPVSQQNNTISITPPHYIQNTPYYDPKIKDSMTEEEREEAADKDFSRLKGNTMYIAIKDHNDTEQYGYATITPNGKGVIVSIHTENSEPPLEVNQPAVIYQGTCEKKGAEYISLPPVLNGRSDSHLQLSFDDFIKQKPLALYIYRNEVINTEYNSCGDLPVK